MLLASLLFVIGMALLIKGADWLVDGATALARRFGVSELTIGLTVVAFGTSIPELTVNVFSSFTGAPDLAIGNVVGSNIANILLILGCAALVRTLTVKTSTVWKEIPFALLASVLLVIMANDAVVDGYAVSELSRSDGAALIAFFLIFLWYTVGMSREESDGSAKKENVAKALLFVTLGLALLVGGGKLAVDNAVSIATALGVSQALIGFTIVAVGTSLPELVTSVVAARKGSADIAVGNIVGSNIFNTFWILGVSSIIKPLPFRPELNADLLVAVLASLTLFFVVHNGGIHKRIMFWRQKNDHAIRVSDGLLMLILYGAYVAYLALRG